MGRGGEGKIEPQPYNNMDHPPPPNNRCVDNLEITDCWDSSCGSSSSR